MFGGSGACSQKSGEDGVASVNARSREVQDKGKCNAYGQATKCFRLHETRVMTKWINTGIQQALNAVVFKLLKNNMIYPVSDEYKYTDHHGNVLPDVYLMPDGSTPFELARSVHTSIAENYVLAIDAKTGIRLLKYYYLRHKDLIKIVTRPISKQQK